jgi:hypothetical protein
MMQIVAYRRMPWEGHQKWGRAHELVGELARFRNATTGGWVLVLAGLGRNGTEAAAQFATRPHYVQLLRDDLGRDFSNLNSKALLRVTVIDGKTGAPSILAVHAR